MKTRYLTLIAALPIAVLIAALALIPAWAVVKGRTVEYRDGDVELQGYFAWDDAVPGKRPGIIVVHEWWGLNDYAKKRADMLAQLGYAALAIDMYGKGKVTEHPQQAGEWAKQIQANVAGWQKRALLGLDILKKDPHVDAQRLAAIGYCFGGATVMEMAYSGADLAGVVSFHGSLPPPTADQMSKIKARILAAHGSEDAFTPPDRVAEFQSALDKAKADWTMITYGGARHSFTVPDADMHGMENLRYNKNADERSWQAMRQFFQELFYHGAGPMNVERWNAEVDGELTEERLRRKLAARGYMVTRYVYPPGAYFPGHEHGVDKIDAVLSGRFRMTMSGESVVLEAGDCMFVPRRTLHSAEVIGADPVVSLDAVKMA